MLKLVLTCSENNLDIEALLKLVALLHTGRGPNSSRPKGQILHRQENQQKQEEDGKGYESPRGTSSVTCADAQLLIFHLCFIELSVVVNLVGQKHKKKKKAEVFNFSAIHLIHDPQG